LRNLDTGTTGIKSSPTAWHAWHSISNSVDKAQFDEREKRYMEIVGRYKDDLTIIRETFPRVLAEVAGGTRGRTP